MLVKFHGSYFRGTGVTWIGVGAYKGCRETFATVTQLPTTGAGRTHAEGWAVSGGVTASRAQWPAANTLQATRMQPMALQLSLDLAVQEAVQDGNKETLENILGVAARWGIFLIGHKYL